ncbi:unnamed protein product [Clonostachys byssicola]|uniref:Uncharacterized protein n=1 Tax=Clonostachys byssicola TaxID=160290 RepID=A0A9N9XYM1_9HYPO|nr:unnamed protein product [Clonostachys byssicola]
MVGTHRVGAAAALVLSLASSVAAVPDAAQGLEENEVSQRDLGESVAGPDIDYKLDDRNDVDELAEGQFELYVRDHLLAPRANADGTFPFNGPGRRARPRRGRGALLGNGFAARGRGNGFGGFGGFGKAGPPEADDHLKADGQVKDDGPLEAGGPPRPQGQ